MFLKVFENNIIKYFILLYFGCSKLIRIWGGWGTWCPKTIWSRSIWPRKICSIQYATSIICHLFWCNYTSSWNAHTVICDNLPLETLCPGQMPPRQYATGENVPRYNQQPRQYFIFDNLPPIQTASGCEPGNNWNSLEAWACCWHYFIWYYCKY